MTIATPPGGSSEQAIDLCDAKTHLSELVDRAAEGEEIIIAKAGTPKARPVPLHKVAKPRQPGAWRGRVRIARDFDAPLPKAVLENFGGGKDPAE